VDKILDLANVSSIIAILVFVAIQVWIQKTTIKNHNIVKSRLNWLKLLKKSFIEYNTALEEIIEFDRQVKPETKKDESDKIYALYRALKNKKIDLTMQFKAYELENDDKSENLVKFVSVDVRKNKHGEKDLEERVKKYLNSFLKKSDDCEKQLLKLINGIDKLYAKRRNPQIEEVNFEEEILLELVQQFEICICKNEWTKINFESNIFYAYISFLRKQKESLQVLKKNLETMIKETRNDSNDVDEPSSISKYTKDIDNIWQGDSTVGERLKKVLTKVAKQVGEKFPNSMKTSTGKRYIYSTDAPVHPTGKDFVNPKKINLPELKPDFYLETNFSNSQARSIAEQIMKKNNYKPEA